MTAVKVQEYCVALFDSVSHAMKAEKILKARGIAHKIIPVPKDISSDCGVCIRFAVESADDISAALSDHLEVREFRPLLTACT